MIIDEALFLKDPEKLLKTPFLDTPEALALKTLAAVERDHIEHALAVLDWQVTRAASILGIDRRTLYRKMARHGIKRPSSVADVTLSVDPSGETQGSFRTVRAAIDSLKSSTAE